MEQLICRQISDQLYKKLTEQQQSQNVQFRQITDQQYYQMTQQKLMESRLKNYYANSEYNSKVCDLQQRLESNVYPQKTVSTKQFFKDSSYNKRLNEQFLKNLQSWVNTLDVG